MVRDDEIKRLTAYSHSMGIPVTFSKKSNEYAAMFYTDGTGIVIYDSPKLSKTDQVLIFLHETGHALHWVSSDRKTDPNVLQALKAEDARLPKDPPISKEQRKLIYDDELIATTFWDRIIKQADIKISKKKINTRKRLDLFQYRYYYENGDFPNRKQIREFLNEIKGQE